MVECSTSLASFINVPILPTRDSLKDWLGLPYLRIGCQAPVRTKVPSISLRACGGGRKDPGGYSLRCKGAQNRFAIHDLLNGWPVQIKPRDEDVDVGANISCARIRHMGTPVEIPNDRSHIRNPLGRAVSPLVVGHIWANYVAGKWRHPPKIEEIRANAKANVVLVSDDLPEVAAAEIIYNCEIAHLVEQAQVSNEQKRRRAI